MHELLKEQIREGLVDGAVLDTASFTEAAETLHDSTLSAIAVITENRDVVGMFGVKQLLHGMFPLYLEELKHSAFIPDDLPGLRDHVAEVSVEPVTAYMVEPSVVNLDSSATHIAEQLLHSDIRALVVVEDGRYVGMVGALRFCWLVYRSLAPPLNEGASSD